MSKSQKPLNTTRAKPVKKRRPSSSQAGNGRRRSAGRSTKPPLPGKTKQAILVDLLSRSNGATLAELVNATGWQRHSVRGAISGTLKKKLGLTVTSEPTDDRGRVYRIA
jgi:hypothetical protein